MTTATSAELEPPGPNGSGPTASRSIVSARCRTATSTRRSRRSSSPIRGGPAKTALDALVALAQPGGPLARHRRRAPAGTRCRSPSCRRGHRRRAFGLDAERAPDRRGRARPRQHPDRRRRVAGSLAELGEPPVADVALIAHVGYDIEAIGPFIEAMERAAGRLCVAVLTDQQPASVADPFWPIVHGIDASRCRPCRSSGSSSGRAAARPRSDARAGAAHVRLVEGLATFLRRQLWIAEDGEKEQPVQGIAWRARRRASRRPVRRLARPASPIGVVTWTPPAEGEPNDRAACWRSQPADVPDLRQQHVPARNAARSIASGG